VALRVELSEGEEEEEPLTDWEPVDVMDTRVLSVRVAVELAELDCGLVADTPLAVIVDVTCSEADAVPVTSGVAVGSIVLVTHAESERVKLGLEDELRVRETTAVVLPLLV
jgi:hypothetical protein